jgi:hypothetical protein
VYAQTNKVEIGTIDSIHSKILNEKRAIWVYVPNNGNQATFTQARYPVVYLLDGDWYFNSVVGIVQHLSYINGNTICPEMIVVGIPSIDRYKDLTPTCDSMYSPTSGGNKKFISFIENELIPYIDSVYPVEPYRMLIGHSLGGLTVMNTLVNNTNLFNAYVAIDPSMWWDKQSSLKETEKVLSKKKFDNVSLFLAISNSMDMGMDTIKVKKDSTKNTLHIRSLLELSSYLKTNNQHALIYQVKYYDNENHGSIPLIAEYDALHFIFNFYHLPLTKKDYDDTSLNLAYKIENHYKNISEKMGYEVIPSENTIYALGFNSLFMKNLVLAEYFFKLNIKNHPESFVAYDSFGDYYDAVGDTSNAIIMYNNALSIKENADTRKKLDKLKSKK